MQKYIDQLNEAQRAPVLQKDGPMIIIAGAGSGKTRVLTIRIAYLMSQGVDAFNILSLTFTNKAAREMRERVWQLMDHQAETEISRSFMPFMGTFHSICVRLLRQDGEHIAVPRNFVIFDDRTN